MPISVNPDTGETFFLNQEGQWEAAKTAINQQTGERFALDGTEWKLLPPPKSAVAKFFSQQPVPEGDLSLGDVASGAIRNVPSSTKQFLSDTAQAFIHPAETAENIGAIGKGVLQKVGLLSGDDAEKYADAVGRFFADRYGSAAGVKRAIATDPIGVLSDLATVLTLGGGAAAKAPGVAGKVGEVAGKVGRTIDPINIPINAAKEVAPIGAAALGVTTGAGKEAIQQAARAGAEGGARAEAFTSQMRGTAPIDDVVREAKGAVATLRQERGDAYRAKMAEVGQDQTVLDFDKIDQGVQAAEKVKNYKGQDTSPKTKAIRDEMIGEIEAWKKLDPKEFHTAEGIDALKQRLGDIRDNAPFNTPQRAAADKIYDAVRQTIVDQVPEYARVMKAYEEASELIREIEKTLSLDRKANIDTALRKLQSVLRNNVNTNYGRREVLADYLVKAGATNLVSKLAGQTLSALAPRGVSRITAGAATLGSAAGLGLGIPALAVAGAALPLTSPRLVGEAAYALGKGSRFAPAAGNAAFQLGRQNRVLK